MFPYLTLLRISRTGHAMSNNPLMFSQRYGYRQLPEAMQLEQLSPEVRRTVWNTTRAFFRERRADFGMGYYLPPETGAFVERVFGQLLGIPEDEIPTSYDDVMHMTKKLIMTDPFHAVLDLSEIMMNDHFTDSPFVLTIAASFDRFAAPYSVDTSELPFRFRPHASTAQRDATQRAIEDIRESNMSGADIHLRHAAKHINATQYADAIADSIHAVVSVVRTIDPHGSKTLGPALDSLQRAGLLNHPSLKQAFKTLYGYTCEEQGIRHPLITESGANVGLDEALFMYGACASFAAYLVSKHRQIGQ